MNKTTCPSCGGHMEIAHGPCHWCEGTGEVTRLQAIEARAGALGGSAWWSKEYNDLELNLPAGVSLTFQCNEANVKAAEALLALYEAKVKVEVVRDKGIDGNSDYFTVILPDELGGSIFGWWDDGTTETGTYVLVPVAKEDE